MTEPSLISQAAAAAAKVSPPMVVTVYALLSKGLPVVVGFLTLAYLSVQISHLLWVWRGEWLARRAARRSNP